MVDQYYGILYPTFQVYRNRSLNIFEEYYDVTFMKMFRKMLYCVPVMKISGYVGQPTPHLSHY